MSEKVLVIQNKMLHPHLNGETGRLMKQNAAHIVDKIISNKIFMQRDQAEHDNEHKQVIPYVVIRNGENYFLLKRLSGQTEKRLHNRYSLGIGGHINPDASVDEDDIILNGLYRELNEEVSSGEAAGLEFVGIINDDSNSVGRVHLGLLYVLELLSPDCRVRETEKMTAQWVSGEELEEYYAGLETWSRIVYDQYIKNSKGIEDPGSKGRK